MKRQYIFAEYVGKENSQHLVTISDKWKVLCWIYFDTKIQAESFISKSLRFERKDNLIK